VPLKDDQGETTMRELKPYQTKTGLHKALDDGGRFYSFFSTAQDSVVSTPPSIAGGSGTSDWILLLTSYPKQQVNNGDRLSTKRRNDELLPILPHLRCCLEKTARAHGLAENPVCVAARARRKVGKLSAQ
jgi:hypothetical protein